MSFFFGEEEGVLLSVVVLIEAVVAVDCLLATDDDMVSFCVLVWLTQKENCEQAFIALACRDMRFDSLIDLHLSRAFVQVGGESTHSSLPCVCLS